MLDTLWWKINQMIFFFKYIYLCIYLFIYLFLIIYFWIKYLQFYIMNPAVFCFFFVIFFNCAQVVGTGASKKKFAFHLLPCGMLYPDKINIIGNGLTLFEFL